MGKPKRSGGGSGLRKNHGPKRHLFKEYKPMIHVMHQNGLLNKYNCKESFILACTARGNNKVTNADWAKFSLLSFNEKKEYFAAMKK